MSEEPHSAEHFTASRDLWWNDDYLDLLARRLDLGRCRAILDLGAGVGHWTAQIARRCAPDAAITAVDREEAWVAALRERFAGRSHFRAIQGDVADLSGLAGPFDLVTCQTLLLHVPDVPGVLAQAFRLLVPGGLLLLAEPNNFLNRMVMTSETAALDPKQYGELAAFWWAFERGRERRGLGREWIAELLPKLIVDAGFSAPLAFQDDRMTPWHPPYDTVEQTTFLAEKAARSAQDAADEKAQTRDCVLAGGLSEAEFERGWRLLDETDRRETQAIAERRYSSSGYSNLCIFAARKG